MNGLGRIPLQSVSCSPNGFLVEMKNAVGLQRRCYIKQNANEPTYQLAHQLRPAI